MTCRSVGPLVLLATALAGCAVPGIIMPRGRLLEEVHLRGAPDRPLVALTFDDGPNGRCTAAVLDALADVHAPATFFVLGRNVDAGGNDDVLARMVREGHTIGLHGYQHEGRLLVVPKALRAQLGDARRAIRTALARGGIDGDGPPIRFFRPPFGFVTSTTAETATAEGYTIVLWTVSVEDWRSDATAPEVVAKILDRAGPGAVVVLHDGFRVDQRSRDRCVDRGIVADVVRRLVPALAERGLRIAPLAVVLGLPDAPAQP